MKVDCVIMHVGSIKGYQYDILLWYYIKIICLSRFLKKMPREYAHFYSFDAFDQTLEAAMPFKFLVVPLLANQSETC